MWTICLAFIVRLLSPSSEVPRSVICINCYVVRIVTPNAKRSSTVLSNYHTISIWMVFIIGSP